MGNHSHPLIETAEANLNRLMHYINGSYTNYINRRKGYDSLSGRDDVSYYRELRSSVEAKERIMKIILFVLAIFAFIGGAAILTTAKSAAHEIEGLILLVIFSIFLI